MTKFKYYTNQNNAFKMFIAQALMQFRLVFNVWEITRPKLRKIYVLAFSVVIQWNSTNFRID